MRYRIHHAVDFALKAHVGQTYGDRGFPMFVHLNDVAMLVASFGGTDEEVIAGYLHDTVEDTRVTLDEINTQFGPNVKRMVDLCTDDNSLPGRAEKKAAVNARFLKEGWNGERLVKGCDRLCNQGYSLHTNNMKMMKRYCKEYPEFRTHVIEPTTDIITRNGLLTQLDSQYEQMLRRIA